MKLICKFGEMWARNQENINKVPVKEGGKGICILYDGSMPVYVARAAVGSAANLRQKSLWPPITRRLFRDCLYAAIRLSCIHNFGRHS